MPFFKIKKEKKNVASKDQRRVGSYLVRFEPAGQSVFCVIVARQTGHTAHHTSTPMRAPVLCGVVADETRGNLSSAHADSAARQRYARESTLRVTSEAQD